MSTGPQLTLSAITVHGESTVLVDALSLTALPGQLIGITGPSGAGKTSLLHAIGGLTAPAAGRVCFAGSEQPLWQSHTTAVILQNLWLSPVLTAHEAVALPLRAGDLEAGEVRSRADAALASLGLNEHRGQLISELSGGQRQRVAVARAVAGEPSVILADEPASALDPYWAATVLDRLAAETGRGAIVFLASSDPSAITRCDQVVTLRAGAERVGTASVLAAD